MIYLDHHAATPPCEEAVAAMAAALSAGWANPASVHQAGRSARALVERAREQVAHAIGASTHEVVFTSGGTEACNLGVMGLMPEATGRHIVTTASEHPAVARAVDALVQQGARVTRLSVEDGRVPDVALLERILSEDPPALVAVQWVNHETGTLWPIAAYGAACDAAGVPLFVDGTQALGKVAIDLSAVRATALAMAAHKMGGPAGVGALFVRRGASLGSRLLGGGQERGRRAGTPGVAEIAGFGAACAMIPQRLTVMPALALLRDRIEQQLTTRPASAGAGLGAVVNGGAGERVATVTNMSFPGVSGAELVVALDLEGVCCASGAACSSGVSGPSPVLSAMYPDEALRAKSALRMSFAPQSLDIEYEKLVHTVSAVLRRLSEDSV